LRKGENLGCEKNKRTSKATPKIRRTVFLKRKKKGDAMGAV